MTQSDPVNVSSTTSNNISSSTTITTDDDAVPELVEDSSSAARDPNFGGDWINCGNENLESLLRAQGVPEQNLFHALRASERMTQRIHHTRNHFSVTVNDHTINYSIVSGHRQSESDDRSEEENAPEFSMTDLLTSNTMVWQPVTANELNAQPNELKLVVTSLFTPLTQRSTDRRMVDGKMLITSEADGIRAFSWFERIDENQQRREREEIENKAKASADEQQ